MAERVKLGGKPGRWGAIAGWRAAGAVVLVVKLHGDGRPNCARRMCAADAGLEKGATWRGIEVEEACLGRRGQTKSAASSLPA